MHSVLFLYITLFCPLSLIALLFVYDACTGLFFMTTIHPFSFFTCLIFRLSSIFYWNPPPPPSLFSLHLDIYRLLAMTVIFIIWLFDYTLTPFFLVICTICALERS
ncbi:hypothetical protein FN846DRAFT_398915 [Sphaerosporella brunnea]|uniref:Uncharacterized protein n=1 Tax=Sphaerosporella brunnea TaxID=1250544 RepID=A0A5J5EHD2_9PEZI|nr:hypothetical protein FN846DRAFT_398915 [Sphaerosporella brunnea]